MDNNRILVETKNLHVRFPAKKESVFAKKRYVHAVTDVSLAIYKGETFGLVGESGCGKSTFANATLGFVAPSEGIVLFDGEILDISDKKRLKKQRQKMQKIFQDPGSSLNPRFTVDDAIREPLRIHGGFTEKEQDDMVADILKKVGLSERDRDRNTMEFSGGQQQRIAIARALILKPEYLVCDEPVSALDVSVHAQILNLLMDLQAELGVTYLFISHNLAVVKKLCKRIAIMYLGEIVEWGDSEKIFNNPVHPYTRALIDSILSVDPDQKGGRSHLHGDIASPIDPPAGCRFSTRCPVALPECSKTVCILREVEAEHYVACPYADENCILT